MTEQATLGGGCFWCLEAVFDELVGVEAVQSGYAGGEVPNPTYEQVCSGATGHAEVVQITYDPERITFSDLLDVFFTIHASFVQDVILPTAFWTIHLQSSFTSLNKSFFDMFLWVCMLVYYFEIFDTVV